MRVVLLAVMLVACSSPPEPDLAVEAAGPYGVSVGQRDLVVGERMVRVLFWWPFECEDAELELASLETGPRREIYEGLLAESDCATRTVRGVESEPAAGPFPLVAFSHCHECTRFSAYTIAARLASHGFIVVAPDHAGNTLYEWADGTGVPLDAEFLPVRAADIAASIDLAIDLFPVDPERIGVFGHSFGAVTAGLVAQEDPRIDAAFAIAAPMENPLLEGVSIAELDVPLGFLVAVEDNSITELGNTFIRDNHAAATGDAWKREVADAGHWSFSDLVGLEPFPAGCGAGVRQTDGADFIYLDPAEGRAIAASQVTAFFKATLLGDTGARAYLDANAN